VGNIPYGKSDAELLDVYGTDLGADGIPVFLWVHGGAWLTGNKDWSGFFIQNVYSWGFKSIIVGYPLCPECKEFEGFTFAIMMMTITQHFPY
jgi:acetyl esterase